MVQFGCLSTSDYVYILVSRMEKDQRKLGLLYLGTFLRVSQETSAYIFVRTSLLAAREAEKCKLGSPAYRTEDWGFY